jgi:hypothetical protein
MTGCKKCGCKHESHYNRACSAPSHDKRCYTNLNFCLNCIPCFSESHSKDVFPSVTRILSLSGDRSFLCVECYTNLICTIFEWNHSKIPNERTQSAVSAIKNYNGTIPPENAQSVLAQIAGSLPETAFDEDDKPSQIDLTKLEEFDSIISWNNNTTFVNAGPADYLKSQYSNSLKEWNNFLNPLKLVHICMSLDFEKLPQSSIDHAIGRILQLQIL